MFTYENILSPLFTDLLYPRAQLVGSLGPGAGLGESRSELLVFSLNVFFLWFCGIAVSGLHSCLEGL